MKPNLFAQSTKELSQDAFLCWFALWADQESITYDSELSEISKTFLNFLLKTGGLKDVEIQKVKTWRQWEKIDVWISINDKYSIVIEDKLFALASNNQLDRYAQVAQNWCDKNGHTSILIYYKTGNETRETIEKAESKGYHIIEREQVVEVLDHYRGSNAILLDYKEWLAKMTESYSFWKTAPIKDWSRNSKAWIGFYTHLEKEYEGLIIRWHFVSNPNRGFYNALLNWQKHDGIPLYLQIEQGHLCFKISVDEKHIHRKMNTAERREVRNRISQYVRNEAAIHGYKEVERPYFGNGTSMTVAKVDRKHWLGDDELIAQPEKAASAIRRYKDFLEQIVIS